MLLGHYPCCGGELMLALPDRVPCYEREICPHCGATVWHYLTRLDSRSWTEVEFLRSHAVNQDTKAVAVLAYETIQ